MPSPTKTTVIGQFENPTLLDIFQVVIPGVDAILGMDYTGSIYPTVAIPVVPVIQQSLLRVNTNLTASVTKRVLDDTMFNVAIYMESYGDGAGGTTLVATITWTNVQGSSKNLTLTLTGPTDNIQQENLVILAAAGTDLVVSTAFSGAPFHYDIACNVLILPTAGA